jgi:hypothetical protein
MMTPITKDYRIEDGVTQSILGDWQDCRERSRLKLNLWASFKTKDALIFGGLWHWLMHQSYDLIRTQGQVYGLDSLLEQWCAENASVMADAQEMEKMLAWAEALYDPYWEFWVEDFDRDWLSLESTFDVEWQGFRLRGQRDGVYNVAGRKRKGRPTPKPKPWLLETKTAGQINPDTMEEVLAFDFQNLYYVTASEAELGQPIAGVLYNMVRKPQLRQKKGESFAEYAVRMKEDVRERPKFYFHRFEVAYSKQRKEQFAGELHQKLVLFREWVVGKRATYKNEGACRKRWNCEFIGACAQGSMSGYTQSSILFSELGNV